MKKNKLFLLGLFVVFAAVLSLSLVSNTLAKYTSSGSGSDSARVAKWGVTVTAPNQEALFANAYGDTVSSQGAVDVVAPGTNGTLAAFTITGNPEVAAKITYSAELTLSNWTSDGSDVYCPVIIYVEGEAYYLGKTGITTIAELESAVEGAIAAVTNNYAVGTPIADTLNVVWVWQYEKTLVPSQTDALDTALGNRANNGNSPEIELSVTCTVTQID